MESVLVVACCAVAVWWGLSIVRRRFCDTYPISLITLLHSGGQTTPDTTAALLARKQQQQQQQHAIIISGDSFTALSCLFAATGLLASLALSVAHNYDHVTRTHCSARGFYNFAPSVSACIGDFALQRSVWFIAVACYVPPRLATAFVVYYFSRHLPLYLARLRLALFVGEHLSLVLLTVVTSSVNQTVHQLGFLSFAVLSMLSMASQCILGDGPGAGASAVDKAAYQWRRRWAAANFSSFVAAMFWFALHTYGDCAHYYYSFFAIFEWMFVFTNVGFHCVELIDLRHHQMHITRPPLLSHHHQQQYHHTNNSKVHN